MRKKCDRYRDWKRVGAKRRGECQEKVNTDKGRRQEIKERKEWRGCRIEERGEEDEDKGGTKVAKRINKERGNIITEGKTGNRWKCKGGRRERGGAKRRRGNTGKGKEE